MTDLSAPCESECNPYTATCGAQFCTFEGKLQHERTCQKVAGEPDRPSSNNAVKFTEADQELAAARSRVAELEAGLRVRDDAYVQHLANLKTAHEGDREMWRQAALAERTTAESRLTDLRAKVEGLTSHDCYGRQVIELDAVLALLEIHGPSPGERP